MDIFYQNSSGKRLYLDRGAYKMLAKSSLWDYEWEYSTNNYNGRPQMSGKRKSVKRSINVVVSAGTTAECLQNLSELSNFFDIDVIKGSAGRIYVGSGYLKCFVIKSSKSDKYIKTRRTTVAFDVLPDGEEWIYEQTYIFRPQEESKTGKNLDFNFDFPFDFYNGMSNMALLNEAITDVDFEMIVYGKCENPEIMIDGQKYIVHCQLGSGEYLVINSLTKKIYKVKNDGEKVNQYHLQDTDWYIFQKISSGKHTVSWSGLFGFDITLFERRSEPKWT